MSNELKGLSAICTVAFISILPSILVKFEHATDRYMDNELRRINTYPYGVNSEIENLKKQNKELRDEINALNKKLANSITETQIRKQVEQILREQDELNKSE